MSYLIKRRTALLGTGLGAVAPASRAKAVRPGTMNVGFFTETKPTIIAKGERWFQKSSGAGSIN